MDLLFYHYDYEVFADCIQKTSQFSLIYVTTPSPSPPLPLRKRYREMKTVAFN